MKAKLQPVEVTWHDATSEGGWNSLKEYRARPLAKCRTLGFLSRYDRRAIQVVQTRSPAKPKDGQKPNLDEERVVDCMTIPRQWATRVRVLR